MGKTPTIHYNDGYIVTPDDFNEKANTDWGLVFSEPVTVQAVVQAICDAGLPLIEFRAIADDQTH